MASLDDRIANVERGLLSLGRALGSLVKMLDGGSLRKIADGGGAGLPEGEPGVHDPALAMKKMRVAMRQGQPCGLHLRE